MVTRGLNLLTIEAAQEREPDTPTEDAIYGAENCGADWNQQAVNKAQDYLETLPFSRDGLVRQMEDFDHFPSEQAEYGADNSGADWNQQAAGKAQDHLGIMAYSHDALVTQLMDLDLFASEQTEYGVSNAGL